MNKKLIVAALSVLVITGCANRPESISPSFVAHERYIEHECSLLTQEKNNAIESLNLASDLQDSDANGDAWGVFLIGVPFSKLSGDHEADVAKWKGTVDAIETVQIMNKCDYTTYVRTKKIIVIQDSGDGGMDFAK